ncbi:HlyD family secretion protein [Aliikangiella coralliicola]|uniref:HlyD family efflux transporter periplasmic adaptor subunit n=1 Tax=Aliikangiella coralliicola TaxID=2592383 RepID=A0A545UI79_9GAMM|nr:efflux RND transporter periplasmic adaptor subunit [Aliikangiella coralliicola]TQV89169.1 HlyD family efflux transporter periplasmic adaptor subunit [Aliikangiella coralliicola]
MLRITLLVGALLLVSGCEQQDSSINSQTQLKVSGIVEANGELASSDTAVVSPPAVRNQWRYKITFLAAEGSQVNKGKPIVSFDVSELNQKLSMKKSELKTAQKTLENTLLTNEAKLEKQNLELAESKMKQDKAYRKWQQSKNLESNLETKKLNLQFKIAENETQRLEKTVAKTIESNKVKLAISKSNNERLQSEVDQLKSGIGKMTIKAPKSGIIIYKPDYQGKKISMGDTVWMGRQIIGLPSLDQMIVKAKILEADAGSVKLAQKVEVVLDAVPERVFIGKVTKLGKVFRRKSKDQPNIIFDAEITLENPDIDLMRPGMAARIKIHVDDAQQSSALALQ